MKTLYALVFSLLPLTAVQAQSVGIGTTTPAASAALEVSSTTQGLLLPRLNNRQMNAIAEAVPGLMVFNTNERKFYGCVGASALGTIRQNLTDIETGGGTGAYGQSFVAPLTGLLSSITVYGRVPSGTSTQAYTIRIYNGAGTGGTELVNTLLSFPLTTTSQPIVFPLIDSNLTLTAGQTYTFSLTNGFGSNNSGVYLDSNLGNAGYPNGTYYYNGTAYAFDLRFQVSVLAPGQWVALH